ncbi:MAG: diphthine--ammonia ligase [Nanoarchaeota archaeon]|nr:diphthine--ammonia ligase [Nanoarchaeota archaeon]
MNKQSRFLNGKRSRFNKKIKLCYSKNTKIALSWSGGKDSYLLLQKAIENGFKIKFLFNLIDKEKKISITPPYNKELMVLQSKALGLPLRQIDLSGNPRGKFKEFVVSVKNQGIDTLGMGYIGLKGQREFVQDTAIEAKIDVFEPLCSIDQKELLKEVIKHKIKPLIISVDYKKMSKMWLGKVVNNNFLNYLDKIKNVSYCGERGEFQTLVVDAPFFKKKIIMENYTPVKVDDHYYLYVNKAKLIEKPCRRTYILHLDGPCNQRCLFCMKSDDIENKPKKSYDSVIEEIQKAASSGYAIIDFYGGEPTTYLFLKDIICFANKLGLEATLATNAIMFSSKDYTKDFFNAVNLMGIRVSLHSYNPKIHDKITQIQGSWEKTIKGIRNILKFNKRLSVNIVITSLNYNQLPEITEFVHSLGVKGIKFSGLYSVGRILKNKDLCVDHSLFMPYLKKALKLSKKLNFFLIEIEKMPKEILKDNIFKNVRYIEDL